LTPTEYTANDGTHVVLAYGWDGKDGYLYGMRESGNAIGGLWGGPATFNAQTTQQAAGVFGPTTTDGYTAIGVGQYLYAWPNQYVPSQTSAASVNKRYGLTAQATLDVAQALYERHKLLTYPRTDSRHLTAAIARDTLAGRVAALAEVPEYAGLIPAKLSVLTKHHVDDAKVTDHHAIIPTAAKPSLSGLAKNETLVYDLVVRRFLAMFYPEARYAVTRL